MDRSEVKAIVDRELGPLLSRLGIAHWLVTVTYNLRESDEDSRTEARCTRLADYDKAWIEVDPDQFEDEAELIATLRHELFHVVLSPFDLFTAAVAHALGDDHAAAAVLDRIQVHATERSVINLERMFLGLTSAERPTDRLSE